MVSAPKSWMIKKYLYLEMDYYKIQIFKTNFKLVNYRYYIFITECTKNSISANQRMKRIDSDRPSKMDYENALIYTLFRVKDILNLAQVIIIFFLLSICALFSKFEDSIRIMPFR